MSHFVRMSVLVVVGIGCISLSMCNSKAPKLQGQNVGDNSSTQPEAPFSAIGSTASRDTTTKVPPEDVSAVVNDNTAFAFALYKKLADNENNLFFSPYSIFMALGMTWAASAGETEKEIAGALRVSLPQNREHAALSVMDRTIKNSAGQTGLEMYSTNQMWAERSYTFIPAYIDFIGRNYGADMKVLDFCNSPEKSRVIINKWVEDATRDRIRDLIPRGKIKRNTIFVLSNAIYFASEWASRFQPDSTREDDFYTAEGKTVRAEFMSQKGIFQAQRTNGCQIVVLPYRGKEFSMVVFMPESGKMGTLEDSLNPNFLSRISSSLPTESIILRFPKFEFTSASLSLKKTLSSLGMKRAFTLDADFTRMRAINDLFIDDVFHKAFIKVDEKGTEAAAATAVIGRVGGAAPVDKPVYLFNRPFVFLIRENTSGTVLFLGKINTMEKK